MRNYLNELTAIRHHLHRHPELSSCEQNTAEFVHQNLSKLSPTEMITNVGGKGIVAVFDSGKTGKSIGFRAELDALPIMETNRFAHQSEKPGVAHLCGHDGHTTILLGLATWLCDNYDKWTGRAILIFQPAEETAQGAKAMLNDPRLIAIQPNYLFALHNLPGYETGSIILREGIFASATCGMKLRLTGKTSHAAYPHAGINPQKAMFHIATTLEDLPRTVLGEETAALLTIIHLRLGEIAFGTTPGEADVMATFRAHAYEDLKSMMSQAETSISAIAESYQLKYHIEWVEEFASVENDATAVSFVRKAAQTLKLREINPSSPFPWSEDISYFSQRFPTALFGLGAGIDHPQLHRPDYDFPDELLPLGVSIFAELIKQADLC
ncbi:MAG: amidohydrolase [Candidatus Cloacimonetes bacterium HGW-Cloacimonetes-3]|jgi:amidohydrolase|nr:MAG: amidohydrolase [Candidatus Cloacimonetes bacterium HGW-Cloacimonetes-3]